MIYDIIDIIGKALVFGGILAIIPITNTLSNMWFTYKYKKEEEKTRDLLKEINNDRRN